MHSSRVTESLIKQALIYMFVVIAVISCHSGSESTKLESTKNMESAIVADGISVRIFTESGQVIANPEYNYRLVVNQLGFQRRVSIIPNKSYETGVNYIEVMIDPELEYPINLKGNTDLDKCGAISYIGSPERGLVICAQVLTENKAIAIRSAVMEFDLIPGKHLTRARSDFNQDPVKDPILADQYVDEIDSNKVYWTYRLRGEANANQIFDFADFGVVGANYGKDPTTSPSCEAADGNNNNKIDFADFGVIGANYNRGVGGVLVYRDDTDDPLAELGLLDTSGKISGDFKIDNGSFKILGSGFKQCWFTFTGKGSNFKLQLVDIKSQKIDGQYAVVKNGGATPSAVGDWAMVGREPTHNHRSTIIGATNDSLIWSFPTGGVVYSSPVISGDGTIYVGSADKKIYAINPDGTKKWEYTTGDKVFSSPAVGLDGTIYLGSNDKKLHAIKPDGKERWFYETGSWVQSSPVISSEGVVYIGSNDKSIYAVNPDGTLKKTYGSTGWLQCIPALDSDGSMYYCGWDGKLYAVKSDNSPKWIYEIGWAINSSPTIDKDNTVYVGADDGKLYAVNPNGTIKWFYPTGGGIYSCPAIASDGTIYFGSDDKHLYAINPDGSSKWKFVTGAPVQSSPAIGADGVIYFGSMDKSVYAVDENGDLKWSYTTTGEIQSSPAIGPNGTIYIGSNDNKLYAIGTGDGLPGLYPPQMVSATDGEPKDKVIVTWVAPTSGPEPDGYYIYHSTSDKGVWQYIGKSTTTTFEDVFTESGKTFFYKVQSYKFSSRYNDSKDSMIDSGFR